MKIKKILNSFLILTVILLGFVSFNCEKAFDFTNPFDEDNTLPAPSGLRIASMNDSSISLIWNTNITAASENVEKNVWIVIEESRTYNIWETIDTLRVLRSSTIIYEPVDPTLNYSFRIYTIAGSRKSGYSNIDTHYWYFP